MYPSMAFTLLRSFSSVGTKKAKRTRTHRVWHRLPLSRLRPPQLHANQCRGRVPHIKAVPGWQPNPRRQARSCQTEATQEQHHTRVSGRSCKHICPKSTPPSPPKNRTSQIYLGNSRPVAATSDPMSYARQVPDSYNAPYKIRQATMGKRSPYSRRQWPPQRRYLLRATGSRPLIHLPAHFKPTPSSSGDRRPNSPACGLRTLYARAPFHSCCPGRRERLRERRGTPASSRSGSPSC